MSENNTRPVRDPREIMNSIFARTNTSEKKLLNNWCRATYNVALQIWTRQVDLTSPELKRFLVEVDKALESGDWGFFNPEANNPSEGQAVPVNPLPATPAPQQPVAQDTDDHEEEEEESDESDSDTEEEEIHAVVSAKPVEVAPVPVAQPTPQPIAAAADPFAGFVDAIAQRVAGKVVQPQAPVISEAAIRKIVHEIVDEKLELIGSFLLRISEGSREKGTTHS